ncbi:MAG: hypothetical protein IPM57_11515 [Oligoflexia bacterium]|nr:hypothetical protein [Oligoflexia bacterium]
MNPLSCFDAQTNIQISANIHLGNVWVFEYLIKDPENIILYPNLNGRQNNLWEHTCFEAFVGEKNSKEYFEFNFSTNSAWNIFEFKNYRLPQPPKQCERFEFLKIEFENNIFKAQVKPKNFKKSFYEISLATVIESKKNEIFYWALKHNKSRPDFHLRENFILNAEVL